MVFKDEEHWWTAKNQDGKQGSIPVPYVTKIEDGADVEVPRPGSGGPVNNPAQTEVTRRNQMQVIYCQNNCNILLEFYGVFIVLAKIACKS